METSLPSDKSDTNLQRIKEELQRGTISNKKKEFLIIIIDNLLYNKVEYLPNLESAFKANYYSGQDEKKLIFLMIEKNKDLYFKKYYKKSYIDKSKKSERNIVFNGIAFQFPKEFIDISEQFINEQKHELPKECKEGLLSRLKEFVQNLTNQKSNNISIASEYILNQHQQKFIKQDVDQITLNPDALANQNNHQIYDPILDSNQNENLCPDSKQDSDPSFESNQNDDLDIDNDQKLNFSQNTFFTSDGHISLEFL